AVSAVLRGGGADLRDASPLVQAGGAGPRAARAPAGGGAEVGERGATHAEDGRRRAVRRTGVQDDVRAARGRCDVLPRVFRHGPQRAGRVQRPAGGGREAQPPLRQHREGPLRDRRAARRRHRGGGEAARHAHQRHAFHPGGADRAPQDPLPRADHHGGDRGEAAGRRGKALERAAQAARGGPHLPARVQPRAAADADPRAGRAPSRDQRGPVAGYPVVDFKVELYDGSYHDVDSNEMSFKMAGILAFRNVSPNCKPVLLEPILEVEVWTPDEYQGAVMGDLSSRRGHILGTDKEGRLTKIKALVPEAELDRYATMLHSLTHGRGTYRSKFHVYQEVPPDVAHKVIEARKKEMEQAKAS